MAIINRIGDFQDEMTAWRRDLHEPLRGSIPARSGSARTTPRATIARLSGRALDLVRPREHALPVG